jgi:hypothetical protein
MLRIGKNPTNDLVIKDRAAEDFHCILYISNGELTVEDLKSHYGTLVNGSKVSHAILYPGDELQIGFTRIEWQKLMPALQAIGDTSDAESFLQAQDLNLEVREDSDYQLHHDTFNPLDYTIDSTAELIEKALDADNIKELEYQVTVVNNVSNDAEINKPDTDLVNDEPVASTEAIEKLNPETTDKQEVASNSGKPVTKLKSSDPYRRYYLILGLMIAAMVIAGALIAYVTV